MILIYIPSHQVQFCLLDALSRDPFPMIMETETETWLQKHRIYTTKIFLLLENLWIFLVQICTVIPS